MSWILVLMFTVSSTASITSIPGYKSEEECRLAGKVFSVKVETLTRTGTFVCVPGPS